MENPEKASTYKTKTNTHKHNTICVGHHYTQVNTNNVNRTRTLLQTNGGKDEPNIYFSEDSVLKRKYKH